MATGISPWREAARRLQAIVSFRTSNVGTAELQRRVACIEHAYCVRLPLSYAEFLLAYDGLPRVFHGASLLSTAQLLDPSTAHKADHALAQIQLPGDDPTGSANLPRNDDLVPVGMDDDATIIMALDPSTERVDGEMDIVVWISGLGVRLESFAALLDWLADLLEAERSSVQACAA
jgi:hypothetical protein